MSDRSKAARYLESLQKEKFAVTGAPLDNDDRVDDDFIVAASRHLTALQDSETRDRLREYMEEQLARARRERPTRFESPALYSMMVGYADELEQSARTLGLTVGHRPIFGTLPLGRLNAMAIRAPETSEHIIVFHQGVFGCVNLVTKAVAAAYPVVEDADDQSIEFSVHPDDVDRSLRENPEPVARLADFLRAYVLLGQPHAAEPYFLRDPHSALSSIFRIGGELFVMAHEYGHIIAGHLNQPDVEQRLGDSTVEVVPVEWQQELVADYLGLALTVQAMQDQRKMDFAMGYCGIDLLFSTLDLIERAMGALLGVDPEDALHDSHPPPWMRRESVRAQLERIGVPPEAAQGAIALAEVATATLEQMWERIEPSFEERRRRGERPSPIWSD